MMPVFGDCFAEKEHYCLRELLLRRVELIMGDMFMHDGPKPLYRVQMRTIGGQLDQSDAAFGAGKPSPDFFAPVIGCIVPDNVNG